MTGSSRHAAPVKVTADHRVVPLTRVRLGESDADRGRREAFIQELVFRHPELIPMADIEAPFSPLISACTELATSAGYVDNVWLTPDGGLVLGECKLIRNPQARREVVAQALDYARAISSWGYEDLEREVARASKNPQATLWRLVEVGTDLDEAQFVDAVERRLRTGRLMILIIGDGIQEGVEALTEHLQLHAGIHAGLALVDLSLWDDGEDGMLVVPRVPMKTVLVERGIVLVEGGGARIAPPPGRTATAARSAIPRPITASEPEFYAQLEQRRPGLSEELQNFLASLAVIGVEPSFRRSAVLRFHPGPDIDGSAGYVDNTGRVWLGDPYALAERLGRRDAGDAYYGDIAAILGGSVRRKAAGTPPVVLGADGRTPDVSALLKKPDLWRAAISGFVRALGAGET